jgi:hypothetical protein
MQACDRDAKWKRLMECWKMDNEYVLELVVCCDSDKMQEFREK